MLFEKNIYLHNINIELKAFLNTLHIILLEKKIVTYIVTLVEIFTYIVALVTHVFTYSYIT